MEGLPRRAFIPVLLLASCASPSTALYTLEVPAGAVRRSGARVIELRGIGLEAPFPAIDVERMRLEGLGAQQPQCGHDVIDGRSG